MKPLFDRGASAGIVAESKARVAARLAETDSAAAAVLGHGFVPPECGPEIPAAPARGPFQVFRPIEIVPGSAGAARDAGYRAHGEDRPRRAIRRADVFDRMIEDARRRHDRGGDDDPFVAPFSPAQVAVARTYRDLVERHDAGGMKCASLETGRAGGGRGGEFIDAFVAEGIWIERLRSRIGNGVALSVRRIRPSRRGIASRGVITDRVLVDRVCLGDRTLSDVLRLHGWAQKGEHREALRGALVASLDRMQGYDLCRTAK